MEGIKKFFTGRYYEYAEKSALISILALWIFAILTFSIISITNIPFSIIAIIIGIAMMFLEIPFCTKCCEGPATVRFQGFFRKSLSRAVLYTIFAFIMWLSLTLGFSLLVIPAICLTITAALYWTSLCKKEETSTENPRTANFNEHTPEPVYTSGFPSENSNLL